MFGVIKIPTHFPCAGRSSPTKIGTCYFSHFQNKLTTTKTTFLDPILNIFPLQQNFAKELLVLCVSNFFSPVVQTGLCPSPSPSTDIVLSHVVPITSTLLNPEVNSQSSSYLASQQFVTVDHFLLPEIFFHVGSWDITGSWFSSYFLPALGCS